MQNSVLSQLSKAYIPQIIRVSGRRQEKDKFVGNEFDQPTAGLRRETGCLSFHPDELTEVSDSGD
ncbi:hypothetical protein RD02_13390 [Pectobacterium brasiliense]|nr:hypothetical protein RD02_13390 [Pectobacterium brasiliense]